MDCVEVICIALPSGETLWMEKDGQPEGYLADVLSKWKSEHPEYEGTGCTAGAVVIKMPRDKYMSKECVCGPGSFEWP